jgi:hypothetical protein
VSFGKGVMVSTALFFGPEPKPPTLATSRAADELVAVSVRRPSITTTAAAAAAAAAGFARQVVVFEQSRLGQGYLFSLDHHPDGVPPLSSILLSGVLLKGSRCQLVCDSKRYKITSLSLTIMTVSYRYQLTR